MDILIAEFSRAKQDFIEALDKFPKEKREEILFGEWSLKDLLAHLSGWMIAAAENVRCLKEGKIPPWVVSIDDFNKKNVAERKNWDWRKVYKELVETSRKFIEEYVSLPKESWQKKYWPDKSLTPQRILEIEIRHWKKTHLPQMMRP
jgi:hypothetical protein